MKIINKKTITGGFISLTVLFFGLFLGLKTVTSDATVNFGINNVQGWFQSRGGDIRIESQGTFTDWLPGAPGDNQYCGTNPTYSNAYVSLQGSGQTPGIVFSGARDYEFGSGLPSIMTTNPAFGWIVGNEQTAGYNSQLSRKTSYDFIYQKAIQGGLTPINLVEDTSSGSPVNHCGTGGLSDCHLDSLGHGLYIANDDLHLTSDHTFGSNQNYVILVSGDLTISNRILVLVGSTATFIVKNNIIIDKDFGEDLSSFSSTTPDIEGIYSADDDFIIDGYADCAGHGSDLRLNLSGNIVTGAGGVGGSFINSRTLCDNDATCPVFFINERPDFMLNLPELLRYTNYAWQEVAP